MTVLLLLGSGVAARAQAVDAEDGFAARISQERSTRGLPGLTAAADLQAVARRHAQRMVDRGEPYHNPYLGSEVQGWSIVAENVGVGGPDVETVHQAFMDSNTHRDVILSPDLTEVGVGVVRSSDGQLWVVEVFRRPEAAAPAPAPPTSPPPPVVAPPSSAAAQPAASPPTTSAPTTTEPAATTAVSALPTAATVEGDGLGVGGGRSATIGRLRASGAAPVVIAPDLQGLTGSIPAEAWVAAFLLAGVVGLQGQVLRRLGLVA